MFHKHKNRMLKIISPYLTYLRFMYLYRKYMLARSTLVPSEPGGITVDINDKATIPIDSRKFEAFKNNIEGGTVKIRRRKLTDAAE